MDMTSFNKTLVGVVATIACAGLSASNAFAGVGLVCNALDKSTTKISIALGGGVGFSALSAQATIGKINFSTSGEKGTTPFDVAQGMILGEVYYVDFSDDNAETIIISLRVNIDLLPKSAYPKLEEDDMPGTLTFEGQKPIPVACWLG